MARVAGDLVALQVGAPLAAGVVELLADDGDDLRLEGVLDEVEQVVAHVGEDEADALLVVVAEVAPGAEVVDQAGAAAVERAAAGRAMVGGGGARGAAIAGVAAGVGGGARRAAPASPR